VKQVAWLLAATLLLTSCSHLRTASAIDHLKPCASDAGPSDAYCGTLDVWENRTLKSGRKIALKIVVLPALKQDSVPDPLFFLAGGPGQGAASMASMLQEPFRPIQTERDIVLVDQRGTGKSNPLDCKSAKGDEEDDENSKDPMPLLLQRMHNCLDTLQKKADLRQYTTSIAMDDLDDVRRFLGYSKINVYGGSYGTRAAIVYARQHAENARTVILDGVAPTDMRLPLYAARDGQRDLELLFHDCEKDPACQQRFPKLREQFHQLIERLTAHPEHVRFKDPRTGQEKDIDVKRLIVAGSIFNALYSPVTSALIPLLIDQASKGDYSGFYAIGAVFDPTAESIADGMYFSVACTEDAPHIQPSDIAQEAAGTFMGAELIDLRLKPCDFWPRGTVPANYFDTTPSDIPALILSSQLDPITPPVWGQEVASHWKNAKHIIVPANGHIAAFSGCVMKLMQQFLNNGTAANLDTSCVNKIQRPPFFTSPSGPDPLKGVSQ
jgi:pimeloyl-ACP methyl ester carboxylesterase